MFGNTRLMATFVFALSALLASTHADATLQQQTFTITGSGGETGGGTLTWNDAIYPSGSHLTIGNLLSANLSITGGHAGAGQTFTLAQCSIFSGAYTPTFVPDLTFWCNNGSTSFAGVNPGQASYGADTLYFHPGVTAPAPSTIPASERTVLTNLYASTGGANWTNNTGWLGAVGTECSWHGITCDSTQSHVIEINLGSFVFGNHLVGTLPALSDLTALQSFTVDSNQLTGSIPSLTGLTALRTFSAWGSNQLTGSIPSLSGLTALENFQVPSNRLTGSIPSLNGLTALQNFDVNGNQLTGSIPSLSGLTALQKFYVSNNRLTGPVPAAPSSLVAGASDLCGNGLASSGNPTTDAAWVVAQNTVSVAGGNWLACQTGLTAPEVSLSPTSLTFGDQHIGTTSTPQSATLSNTGSAPLAISSIVTTGDFAVSNNCGSSLAASGSCNLGVTFTPTTAAGRIGVARVTSNAPGSPHIVALSGVGVASNVPICTLTATPSSIRKNGTSILTPTCTPAATTYAWTGGTCEGTTASTCTVTPLVTTSYGVTGTNSYGSSTANAQVTVKAVDLTPILMLLLD